MAYIGGSEAQAQKRQNRFWNFTVTSPTNTFQGNDDRGNPLTLPNSYEQYAVYYNGVRLSHISDYTHSGSVLTFNQTTNNGDVVGVEVFTSNEIFSFREPLPITGGIATGNLQAPDFARTNTNQPSDNNLLSRKNAPYLGDNSLVRTNASVIDADLEIPSNTNGMSAGPIEIANNVTITVSGSWVVV